MLPQVHGSFLPTFRMGISRVACRKVKAAFSRSVSYSQGERLKHTKSTMLVLPVIEPRPIQASALTLYLLIIDKRVHRCCMSAESEAQTKVSPASLSNVRLKL